MGFDKTLNFAYEFHQKFSTLQTRVWCFALHGFEGDQSYSQCNHENGKPLLPTKVHLHHEVHITAVVMIRNCMSPLGELHGQEDEDSD
jgi:hypothetical protein